MMTMVSFFYEKCIFSRQICTGLARHSQQRCDKVGTPLRGVHESSGVRSLPCHRDRWIRAVSRRKGLLYHSSELIQQWPSPRSRASGLGMPLSERASSFLSLLDQLREMVLEGVWKVGFSFFSTMCRQSVFLRRKVFRGTKKRPNRLENPLFRYSLKRVSLAMFWLVGRRSS